MSLIKKKAKAHSPDDSPKVYPTWDAFIQAKANQTNELLSRMDLDKLRKLIESKK